MIGREPSEIDTEKHQRRLNELYRARKDIVEGIKDLRRKQRLAVTDRPRTLLQNQSTLHQRPSNEELPRSQSNLDHPHLNTQQEEIKKVVEAHEGLKERNKRLLGGLNKHLQKAESRLTSESVQAKSKQSIEERVAMKQREQAQQFSSQKRRQIESQLQRLSQLKESNSREMLASENLILKNKFFAYVSDLEHCLFTHTLPSLAWKPSPQAPPTADVLRTLANASGQALHKATKPVIEQIGSYSQHFDFNSYRMQNEREFYANYLDNYFATKVNFISTKTQPPILWLPKTHNQRTSQLLNASIQASKELRQTISEENDAFYKRFEKEPVNLEEHSDDSDSEH